MGADFMVIRHSHSGAAETVAASGWINARIINAGDGTHEHPTQALLDAYTVRTALARTGGFEGLVREDVAEPGFFSGRGHRSLLRSRHSHHLVGGGREHQVQRAGARVLRRTVEDRVGRADARVRRQDGGGRRAAPAARPSAAPASRPAPAPRPAASGLDDLDDDIPF